MLFWKFVHRHNLSLFFCQIRENISMRKVENRAILENLFAQNEYKQNFFTVKEKKQKQNNFKYPRSIKVSAKLNPRELRKKLYLYNLLLYFSSIRIFSLS